MYDLIVSMSFCWGLGPSAKESRLDHRFYDRKILESEQLASEPIGHSAIGHKIIEHNNVGPIDFDKTNKYWT